MSDIKILKPGENSNHTYIYVLIDPDTNMVRYVGKADNPIKRLSEHIRKSKYSNTHKNNWIISLIKKNLKPIIEIIDVVSTDDWGFWEQYWIDQFKCWGFNLTNIANGGCGGDLGFSVRQIISNKLKNKNCSENTKKKLRDFRLGKSYDELYGLDKSIQIRNKMSENRCGVLNNMYNKKHTDETKLKISNKSKINCQGENNPFFGKKHTEESINKIKLKLSIINSGENNPFFGKKHSEELKIKKRKKVMQFDLNDNLIKTWDSISEAADTLGIKQSGISNVCNKENRTYYNYKWIKIN